MNIIAVTEGCGGLALEMQIGDKLGWLEACCDQPH